MRTETVRLNIILPKEQVESLSRIAGSRNRSRIISESINPPKDSKAKADQIRTLDKSKLIKRIRVLDERDVEAIDGAIRIHLHLRDAET